MEPSSSAETIGSAVANRGGLRPPLSPPAPHERAGADWLDRERAWRLLAARLDTVTAALASSGEPTCLPFAAGDPVARCERLARGLGVPTSLVATVILREYPVLRRLVLTGWVA